jgi:hypothetical protein
MDGGNLTHEAGGGYTTMITNTTTPLAALQNGTLGVGFSGSGFLIL